MNDFNPYEAPSSAVEDRPEAEAPEPADRGTRLGAKLLDWLVLWGTFMVVGVAAAIFIPLLIQRRQGGAPDIAFLIALVVLGAALVIGLMAWNLVWLHRYGQTIGKRILRIRIVRSSGEPISLGRVVGLRTVLISVLEFIPILGPLFSLVNVCFIFRDDRRCIHDLIADTLVVKVV